MDLSPQRILVLYWYYDKSQRMRPAVRSHLNSLKFSEVKHNILFYNAFNGAPAWLRYLRFDVVILHTTFLCMRGSPLFYAWKRGLGWIRDLNCVKIAMPQDEYDHSEILDEWMYEWKVPIIFTNFGEGCCKILYPIMHDKASFYECLTGYIDETVAKKHEGKWRPPEERRNDIVYRGSHLPYWFGSHGQLKHRIADVVMERSKAHGLKWDISTRVEDTIIGDQWFDFLASGRAVIGCESGSSAIDRRGEIRARIQTIMRDNPSISFEGVNSQMPAGWDDYQFFAISPRHFEAIITKTCQILVEGWYNGILEADKHYIPLKRDFSNIDEVFDKLRSVQYMRAITERAYNDICLSGRYTYEKLTTAIERALFAQKMNGQDFIKPSGRLRWKLGYMAGRVADRMATEKAKIEHGFLLSIRKRGFGS